MCSLLPINHQVNVPYQVVKSRCVELWKFHYVLIAVIFSSEDSNDKFLFKTQYITLFYRDPTNA